MVAEAYVHDSGVVANLAAGWAYSRAVPNFAVRCAVGLCVGRFAFL